MYIRWQNSGINYYVLFTNYNIIIHTKYLELSIYRYALRKYIFKNLKVMGIKFTKQNWLKVLEMWLVYKSTNHFIKYVLWIM